MNRKNTLRIWLNALLAIVIAVGLFAASGLIPSASTKLDMTSRQLITPSETVLEMVKSLDKDVTVYLLATKGNEDTWMPHLFEKYAAQSKHLTFHQAEPASLRGYLGLDTVTENSLLIVCGEEYALIDSSFIYEYQYAYTYSGYSVSDVICSADEMFSRGLKYVTREDLPVVYKLTGHGEAAITAANLSNAFHAKVHIRPLALDGAVPEDAAILQITAPAADYTEAETAALREYLADGGRLLLETNYNTDALPNLDALLAEYGMSRTNGLVVDTTRGYYYSGSDGNAYNYYLTPAMPESDTLPAMNAPLLPIAHALQKVEGSAASVSVLLETSEASYMKDPSATKLELEEGDPVGPFSVALVSDLSEGRIVWLSSPSFSDAPSNHASFKALISWLTDVPEDAEIIPGKSLMGTYLKFTATSAYGLLGSFILFPLALLLIGLILTHRKK